MAYVLFQIVEEQIATADEILGDDLLRTNVSECLNDTFITTNTSDLTPSRPKKKKNRTLTWMLI